MTFTQILILIGSIGGALGVIIKYIIKPINHFNQAMEKLIMLDESNKIILESLLAIMNTLITGNNTDKLKKQRDQLEKFCIEK